MPPQLDEVEGVPPAACREIGGELFEAVIQRVADRFGDEAFDGFPVKPTQT